MCLSSCSKLVISCETSFLLRRNVFLRLSESASDCLRLRSQPSLDLRAGRGGSIPGTLLGAPNSAVVVSSGRVVARVVGYPLRNHDLQPSRSDCM